MSVATTARARIRAELTREILDAARRNLIESGAQNLSLRAVARSLGMAPSGLYRYFAGRDDLLTALIIDSYGALGAAAVAADAACDPADHLDRWRAVTDAIWDWGHGHPQEWALVYGSPVPGYRAPEETVEVAAVVISVMVGIVTDAAHAGRLAPAARQLADPDELGPTLDGVRTLFDGLDDAHVVATMAAWGQAFGMVSMHLFGHLEGGVTRAEPLWRQLMADQAQLIGLRPLEKPL